MRAKGRRPINRQQTVLRQPTSMNRICRVAAYLNIQFERTGQNRRTLFNGHAAHHSTLRPHGPHTDILNPAP